MDAGGRETGSVDWTALAAVAASVAALAALVTTLALYTGMRREAQRADLRSGLDSLWHFAADWDNGGMVEIRSGAATALLANRPDRDVDAVLDFFDEIALLVHRGVLDEELVWYEFYWPMANYWLASKDYVEETRADDPAAWEELGAIMPRLQAIEARRRKRPSGVTEPTRSQMRDFLEGEVGESECAPDDEESHMTPL
jgi:hypothetical protein